MIVCFTGKGVWFVPTDCPVFRVIPFIHGPSVYSSCTCISTASLLTLCIASLTLHKQARMRSDPVHGQCMNRVVVSFSM